MLSFSPSNDKDARLNVLIADPEVLLAGFGKRSLEDQICVVPVPKKKQYDYTRLVVRVHKEVRCFILKPRLWQAGVIMGSTTGSCNMWRGFMFTIKTLCLSVNGNVRGLMMEKNHNN